MFVLTIKNFTVFTIAGKARGTSFIYLYDYVKFSFGGCE